MGAGSNRLFSPVSAVSPSPHPSAHGCLSCLSCLTLAPIPPHTAVSPVSPLPRRALDPLLARQSPATPSLRAHSPRMSPPAPAIGDAAPGPGSPAQGACPAPGPGSPAQMAFPVMDGHGQQQAVFTCLSCLTLPRPIPQHTAVSAVSPSPHPSEHGCLTCLTLAPSLRTRLSQLSHPRPHPSAHSCLTCLTLAPPCT